MWCKTYDLIKAAVIAPCIMMFLLAQSLGSNTSELVELISEGNEQNRSRIEDLTFEATGIYKARFPEGLTVTSHQGPDKDLTNVVSEVNFKERVSYFAKGEKRRIDRYPMEYKMREQETGEPMVWELENRKYCFDGEKSLFTREADENASIYGEDYFKQASRYKRYDPLSALLVPRRLHLYQKASDEDKPNYSITRDEFAGSNCFLLIWVDTQRGYEEKSWIAPEQGYNVVRREFWAPIRGKQNASGEKFLSTLEEYQLEQINDIWLPMKYERTVDRSGGGKTWIHSYEQMTIDKSTLKVNSGLADEIFTFHGMGIQQGVVHDHRNKETRVYNIGSAN